MSASVTIYTVIAVCGESVSILLLLTHLFQFIKYEILTQSKSNQNSKPTVYKAISILTIMSVIFFTFCMTTLIAKYTCNQLLDKSVSGSYQLAKCCMYLVFILRLYYVFKDSNYAYNIKFLYIWSLSIIVVYLLLTIYGISSTTLYKSHTFCYKEWQPLYLLGSLLVDVINSIATCLAFVIPLIKTLIRLKKDYNYDTQNTNDDFKYSVTKIVILEGVIVSTSFTAHIIGMITGTDIIFLIDTPFNCLCIMLMTSYYDKLYKKLCCGLIKCMTIFDPVVETAIQTPTSIVDETIDTPTSNQISSNQALEKQDNNNDDNNNMDDWRANETIHETGTMGEYLDVRLETYRSRNSDDLYLCGPNENNTLHSITEVYWE